MMIASSVRNTARDATAPDAPRLTIQPRMGLTVMVSTNAMNTGPTMPGIARNPAAATTPAASPTVMIKPLGRPYKGVTATGSTCGTSGGVTSTVGLVMAAFSSVMTAEAGSSGACRTCRARWGGAVIQRTAHCRSARQATWELLHYLSWPGRCSGRPGGQADFGQVDGASAADGEPPWIVTVVVNRARGSLDPSGAAHRDGSDAFDRG